jgi:DNA-binding MarR family transcriptional regulator
MDRPVGERSLAAWTTLVSAHASVVEAVEERLMAEAGLPLPWHEVLVRVSRAGEDLMRMQELARSVLLSKSGLTRLADRMEQAGLIERRACPSDRRGIFIGITDQGREALDRAGPVFLAAVREYLIDRLSREELDNLVALLERVRGADPVETSA